MKVHSLLLVKCDLLKWKMYITMEICRCVKKWSCFYFPNLAVDFQKQAITGYKLVLKFYENLFKATNELYSFILLVNLCCNFC